MAASDSFAAFLREQLAPLGPVALRRMFGATGVFCGPAMLGLVVDNTLYLRVDEANRALFAEAAATPFRYDRQGRAMELPYWRLPERLFDEPEEFLAWARAALAAAQRLAAKRGRRAPPRDAGAPGRRGC